MDYQTADRQIMLVKLYMADISSKGIIKLDSLIPFAWSHVYLVGESYNQFQITGSQGQENESRFIWAIYEASLTNQSMDPISECSKDCQMGHI